MRFLATMAALLAVTPPPLIALNEPESSLHPQLFEPLADLIAHASRTSQLWITTHSDALAQHIAKRCGCKPIVLELNDGATEVMGKGRFGFFEDAESDDN